MPEAKQDEYLYSPVVSEATTATFAVGSNLTWDAYWRKVYDEGTKAIQRQANELLKRGNLVEAEMRALVESQRNALVLKIRQHNSPFGRAYSEILKPSGKLPTLEQLVAQKGSYEAVLTSVGKSRAVVNKLAVVSRVAGPATIVLQITVSATVIYSAPPEERARVAAREAGGVGFGSLAGWGGMWAGCAGLAALVAPSLVIPIVGKVTTGTACVVGGIAGGAGAGWLGYILGQWAGEATYDFTTDFMWLTK